LKQQKNERKQEMIVRKINIFALTALLVSASSAGASEIVHQFNSPAFSGIGYTQHVLSVYNQEQAAKQKIKDEKAQAEAKAELKLMQDPIYRFKQALESRMYQELAKQITDNIFGESGISEGVLDFPTGGTVSYKKDGSFITLTITDANGTVTVIKVPVATMVGAAGGG
jgi:LytS/YehU family sensor histidine kinase